MGVGFRICLTEAFGTALEEDRAISFWEEPGEDEGATSVDEGDPEGPAPADGGSSKAAEDRGEKGTPDSGLGVKSVMLRIYWGSSCDGIWIRRMVHTTMKIAKALPRVSGSP